MRFASLHFPHQIALVVFLLLLLAVAVGCTKPPQPKTQASAGASQENSSAGESAKSTAGDAALTAKVKTALASDAGLQTLKIDVDASGGVVTLKGQVESDEAKKRLQEITQAVPGVTWVQNQVSVAPKAS